MFLLKCKLYTLAQKFWPRLLLLRLTLAHHRHLIRLGIENESDFAVISYFDAMRGILPVTDGHGKLSHCICNVIHNQSLFRHFLLLLVRVGPVGCIILDTMLHQIEVGSTCLQDCLLSLGLDIFIGNLYGMLFTIHIIIGMPHMLTSYVSWNRPGVSSNGLHGPSNQIV
nr:MAG TPA: hypothetical protein [Caudoviricetes sp.]